MIAFFVVASVAAAIFLRLGFWQLARLAERKELNSRILARIAEPPIDLRTVGDDTTGLRFRKVLLSGRYDFANEVVLAARTRNGAPGVHILTPLLLGNGQAVLVNRGWVYAPDGMTVDLLPWREPADAEVRGWVDVFSGGPGTVRASAVQRGIMRLQRDSVKSLFPYPIAGVIAVQELGTDPLRSIDHPFRVERPTLPEGQHRSYAIQWFFFAAITIAGAAIVAKRGRTGAVKPKELDGSHSRASKERPSDTTGTDQRVHRT
jgi:surfeit locus 1 family protein